MELKILCVHGVGRHPHGGPWEGAWRESIQRPLAQLDPSVVPVIEFVYLDDIFDQFEISPLDVLEALVKLGTSALVSPFRQPKSLGDSIRWTAGMVVQWVENDKLRRLTRERVAQDIRRFDPHMVVAHSLGSLVCYDAFTTGDGPDLVARRRFVSAGSQIGNPFVMGNFAIGRLTPLKTMSSPPKCGCQPPTSRRSTRISISRAWPITTSPSTWAMAAPPTRCGRMR
jgi:hypothetical protein